MAVGFYGGGYTAGYGDMSAYGAVSYDPYSYGVAATPAYDYANYGGDYDYGYGQAGGDWYNSSWNGYGYENSGYNSYEQPADNYEHDQRGKTDYREPRDYGDYDDTPRRDRRGSGNRAARLTEGNLQKLDKPARRRDPDERSTGSRRSSVGSQWRGITTDGAHSRYRRRTANGVVLGKGEVAKPTGRRMALIVAINPERSACATNSAKHMKDFLKRYQFTVEEAFYTGDNEQFEADVQTGIEELVSIANAGDSVFFHCIGYGVFEGQNCTKLLNTLASGLPEGVKLTCVLDSCYLATRPAFRIDHRQGKSKAGGKRFAQQMGPAQPVRPAIFCYMGEADHGDIAQFRSRDGQSCTYTTAWILSFRKKDIKGYWNEPPSYANLSWGLEYEIQKILAQQTRKNHCVVTNLAACSDRFDIDQPAFL